ncbi:AMED_5909 family protein [Kibdelosporangium philippinense]
MRLLSEATETGTSPPLQRSRRAGAKATTLADANAVTPMTPPEDASLGEQRDFYQARADMYRRVSETDRRHHWEALACAGLEQEKADLLRVRIEESKVVDPP